MSLIPLKLPPGIARNGTDFEQSGRWRDANLVRWHQGSMRPVGGWTARTTTGTISGKARGMLTWTDNSSNTNTAIGTNSNLYYVSQSGGVTDITPSGLTSGSATATTNTGYGGGYYGGTTTTTDADSLYGRAQPSTGIYQEVGTWALDNWGEYLLAVSPDDETLYEWQLNTSVTAQAVSNAPTCKSMVVTEERFVMALHAGGNPRKVQWCDQEDNTSWTANATNQAGDLELQTNGIIMCGARMRGRTLILTTTDAHIATYQGAPFVYGIERVGTACGISSRKALVAVDEGAFWMGKKAFFMFDGQVARELACEVSDYVFDDINADQITKSFAVNNSKYGEVWWFYPSEGSTEVNKYVAFDYKENHWHIGELTRTTGVDAGVFRHPIWVDDSNVFYNHESGFTHGTDTPYCESAPISLGNGDQIMKVNQLIPDEATQGEVKVQFKTRFYPNDTETTHNLLTMGNPVSTRFSGRQIRMKVQGNGNNDWRVGVMRIETKPGGRR